VVDEWDHADGESYDPERDRDRLKKQYHATLSVMSDHEWHEADHITASVNYLTGDASNWAAVSARLRDIRKPENGGWGKDMVQRRYVRRGVWEYRLRPEDERPAEPGQVEMGL
jgi:hypothetical protein